MSDRNDDGDTLELDLLNLFSAWPEASLRLVLGCVASDDPGTRLVGIWGLSVIDFGGTEYFGPVAEAASDPDPQVRADVVSILGSVFGVGDPPRALATLVAGSAIPRPRSEGQPWRPSARRTTSRSPTSWWPALMTQIAGSGSRSHGPWPDGRTHWSAALERLAADQDADVRDAARAVLELPTRSL
ncbi:hypothetical protein GCM10018966_094840 [Streptomyces yanii]